MKTAHFACLAAALLSTAWTNISSTSSPAPVTVEEYEITLRLRVPRIYNNTQSLGQRRYQPQTLKGTLLAIYDNLHSEPTLEFASLSNRTHRVGGQCVTYQVSTSRPVWCLIGDNALNKFRTSSIAFDIDADPSYNIGADEPDNTLILTLAGSGSPSRFSGTASGQLGCGCKAYGHTSPTRVMQPNGEPGEVTDIAAVFGYWNAKLVRSYTLSQD